jgi:signal transduction histidine kinase
MIKPQEANVPEAMREELADVFAMFNATTRRLEESHRLLQARVESLQQELARKNAELERKKRLAALGEMAAGVAHEIRNPLGGIQLYARLLERELAKPEDLRIVRKIIDGVKSLNNVVEGMLAFTSNIVPRPALCNLENVIEEAVSYLLPQIEESSCTVVCDFPQEPVMCWADAELMKRAFMNIIKNGVEAMKGGGTLRIYVSRETPESATICFKDTGPGIPQDALDKIFNPFFTSKPGGTGLGLAIVHGIVEACSGRIAAGNAAEGGAVFEITLPKNAAARAAPSGQTLEAVST